MVSWGSTGAHTLTLFILTLGGKLESPIALLVFRSLKGQCSFYMMINILVPADQQLVGTGSINQEMEHFCNPQFKVLQWENNATFHYYFHYFATNQTSAPAEAPDRTHVTFTL